MLVNERPLFLGVAFVADLVARGVGPQLFRPKRPVRAVAIVALDESLIHPVMKRPGELGAHIQVTAIAKFRCLRFHQKLAFFGVVRRVAIEASDIIAGVG